MLPEDEIARIRAEDFEPWHGGSTRPADWNSAWKVLHRDGRRSMINVSSGRYWEHDPEAPEDDVVGYVRLPIPAPAPRRRGEREYVVRGRWPFPLDMLRKDGSRPATTADAETIAALCGPEAPDRSDADTHAKVDVTLVGPSTPVWERWESFRWEVVGDADVDADRLARDAVDEEREKRRARRAALASARAKLTDEEAAAIAWAKGDFDA